MIGQSTTTRRKRQDSERSARSTDSDQFAEVNEGENEGAKPGSSTKPPSSRSATIASSKSDSSLLAAKKGQPKTNVLALASSKAAGDGVRQRAGTVILGDIYPGLLSAFEVVNTM